MDLCGDQADNFIRIFPRADLTIFLDLDPITLRQRTLNSFDVTVPEGYYVNIIRKFRELSARYGFVQIDANLGREEISVLIYDILLKSLRMR
jgi:thymidylate kinase